MHLSHPEDKALKSAVNVTICRQTEWSANEAKKTDVESKLITRKSELFS